MSQPKPPPGFRLVGTSGPPEPPPGFRLVGAPRRNAMQDLGGGFKAGVTSTAAGLSQLGSETIGANPVLQLSAQAYTKLKELGMPESQILETLGKAFTGGQAFTEHAARANRDEFEAGAGQSTAGKIGNVAGQIVASAPAGMLGKVAAPLQGLRAAVAAGALTGAAGAATQPVLDTDFGTGKLSQVGVGAGTGALAGGVLSGLGSVAERLLPSNAIATVLNTVTGRAAKKPFAAEGEALARRTGVQLTPAAITGGKAHTMAENAARQSIFSRDAAFAADSKVAAQTDAYITGILGRIKGGSASADQVGQQVQGAVRNAVSALAKSREKIAAQDYGQVRQLIGNGPSPIRPVALADRLQGILDEFDSVPAKDAATVANWARTQMANLEPIANDLNKLIQTRRFWSQASAGKANIFDDVNPGLQRKVAAQMVGAIDEDLARAGDALGGPVGDALKNANANYRRYSQAIDALERSPLGKLVGDDVADELGGMARNAVPGEKAFARIKAMEPSELKLTAQFLGKQNPDALAAIKRRYLEDALDAARMAAPSEGANTVAIRGNTFINSLARTPRDVAKLRELYGPKELAEINDAFDVIRRWGDKTGYNFSGTAGQSEVLGVMNQLKDLTLRGTASVGGAALGGREIARLMNDSGGRAALLQIKRLPPQSAKARELAAYISAIVAGDAAIGQPQGVPAGAPGQYQGASP